MPLVELLHVVDPLLPAVGAPHEKIDPSLVVPESVTKVPGVLLVTMIWVLVPPLLPLPCTVVAPRVLPHAVNADARFPARVEFTALET